MFGERTKVNLGRLILAVVLLVAASTYGLAQAAGISHSESFYQTILILLTHEEHAGFHQPAARVWVIVLVVSSWVLVAYLLKWFAEYMIGFSDNVRRRKIRMKVSQLKNHYIVCGFGRVGNQ